MTTNLNALASQLKKRNRRALGKALSLAESTLSTDQKKFDQLIKILKSQPQTPTLHLGVTGSPGAGKSTLIEALGLEILKDERHHLGVLTIDPSSQISGGSILGDKTRMTQLSAHTRCFIRPSPNSLELGGITLATQRSLELLDHLHFTHIVIETVGVGQSETIVRYLCDLVLYVALATSGDELQGIKKGIMEIVDLIAVNKADLLPPKQINLAVAQLRTALSVTKPGFKAKNVLSVSALEKTDLPKLHQRIQDLWNDLQQKNQLFKSRKEHRKQWFYHLLKEQLLSQLQAHPHSSQALSQALKQIEKGHASPLAISDQLYKTLLS